MEIYLIQSDSDLGKGSMAPLGLLFLAAYLKKHDVQQVEVIDLLVEENREKALKDALLKIDIKKDVLIGFYMNTRIRFAVQEAIKQTRKILPNAIICAGGPHPTLDVIGTLKGCPELDFIVIGEGELTFYEVVSRLKNNFDVNSIAEVSGVAVRIDNEIINNGSRKRCKDLDEIPIPDRRMVNMSEYSFSFPVIDQDLQKTLKPASMITSRGCPYKCIFCSVADQWGRFNTYTSPDRVIEEMKLLKKEYRCDSIYFFDDTFTINRKRVIEICTKMIEDKLQMVWFCEIRANTVDEELLSLMYKAGLRSVAMGVESASPEILEKVVQKGISLKQVDQVVDICNRLGIFIKLFFTWSFPEESFEDVKITLDYMKKSNANAPVQAQMMIYPGTPVFQIAKEKGIVKKEFTWFEKYPFYDTLSHPATVPLYVENLSEENIRWIKNELRNIGEYRKKNNPNVIVNSSKRKVDIFALGRSFFRDVSKVKSFKDLSILFEMVNNKLHHMIN